MEHCFNVEIATKYGVEEAILLQHIYYWVEKNKANEKNFYDGRYWTYNSSKAFNILFPYMPKRTITRKLQNLIDNDLILSANYNENKYDRTLWYALTDYAESIMPKSQIDNAKMATSICQNGKCICQNGEPIPNINTDINTNNKKESKTEASYDEIINQSVTNEDTKAALYEFIKMRKLIKKPMTNRALELLIGKLKKLSNANSDAAVEIINQSITNNWQDIYPIKENNNVITQPKTKKANFTERTYSKDDMDKMFSDIHDVDNIDF